MFEGTHLGIGRDRFADRIGQHPGADRFEDSVAVAKIKIGDFPLAGETETVVLHEHFGGGLIAGHRAPDLVEADAAAEEEAEGDPVPAPEEARKEVRKVKHALPAFLPGRGLCVELFFAKPERFDEFGLLSRHGAVRVAREELRICVRGP